MRRLMFGFLVLAVGWIGSSAAAEEDFPPLQPLDLEAVSPEFAQDMFGPWRIASSDGEKTCRVVLLEETTIGGMQIEVDPACASAFPVMDDVTAWRLLEGWAIDLVNAERKTVVRFTTPDERYVATPKIDGIATIEQARE
jgi:hypothetical protein